MTKIVGIGPHYESLIKSKNLDFNATPHIFIKPMSSIVSSGQKIIIPSAVESVFAEVEIAVRISTKIRNINFEEKDIEEFIDGYTISNDITAFGGENVFGNGKLYDTFTPLATFIPVIKEEIIIESYLNGRLMQKASSKEMGLTFSQIVSYISSIITLEKGDIILTGTPSGPFPIKEGDKVKMVSPQLGELRNEVIKETTKWGLIL